MSALNIITIPLGPYQVNTYLVVCRKTGKAIIIDPADEPQTIIDTLNQENATTVSILNTHGHPDHMLANAALKIALDVPVWMHREDSGLFSDSPEIDLLEKQSGLKKDPAGARLWRQFYEYNRT